MNQRCTFVESDGFHHCGSYAFNLQRDGIDQGTLCDVHYWQARVAELEYHLQTLLHAYRTGNSISTIREAEMRKAADLPN
jgi:hypothetical protein